MEDDETLGTVYSTSSTTMDTAAFESLPRRLASAAAFGEVSFQARDLGKQAETVRAVENTGHEVVFHGSGTRRLSAPPTTSRTPTSPTGSIGSTT